MIEQKGSTNKFDTPQANYIRAKIVEALHSKPTLFAAFLFFLAKNAMSASLLNAFY